MERKNWNYDNSGAPVAPATPSPEQVVAEIASGADGPSPATQSLVEPATTVVSTRVRDESGKILRPDWSKPAPVPAVSKDPTRPNWNQPARDEGGRFLSKTDSEMRQVWDREGGLAHVAQTVMRKEETMYSVAPSLEAKVTEHLDKGFLMKAADHLRLGVGHGPEGFWRSVAQFEDSLTPSEREAWAKFCRSLDADEQAALVCTHTVY
jgi:hypothetical protein